MLKEARGVSRRGEERMDLLEREPTPLRPLPERTEQERKENRRTGHAEDRQADARRWRPTIPEQQLLSVLAMLGERYGEDYAREVKIKEADGWFLTHVDVAWPSERLAIEVYGGPHHKPFFDPAGTRGREDADRIA